MTNLKLDKFTQAYIDAALWSSTDDDGEPLDRMFNANGIHLKTLERMIQDCAHFQREGFALYDPLWTNEQAGHDFWFTRNHHGVGFWDRGNGEAGELLTRIAHSFGEVSLYVGDDGEIHA